MYPTEQERNVLQAAEALMEQTMSKYDPSHDSFHVQRVRRSALAIAADHASQHPDLLIVELAALFHDIVDKKYVPAAEAADPYAFLLPFFTSVAQHIDLVEDGRARHVARIVENVSWSTEKALRERGALTEWHESCIELHCVQDADRLDAIGALGIMRCAAYSAVANRPLHVHSTDPSVVPDSAIEHFHDKLLKIKDRLKTETGKRWGQRRHHVMLEFLKAVEEETDI